MMKQGKLGKIKKISFKNTKYLSYPRLNLILPCNAENRDFNRNRFAVRCHRQVRLNLDFIYMIQSRSAIGLIQSPDLSNYLWRSPV